MATNYRGKHDIIDEILNACMDSKTRTRIMYDSHLSWSQLKQYLESLQHSGLLLRLASDQFKTTEKGVKFTKIFHEIKTLVG